MKSLWRVVSLLALAAGSSADLQPIEVKGSKFFYKNGTQFFMKGIAYQQDSAAGGATTKSTKYHDPLADKSSCERDVPLLKELGTNVIRTYAIDPSADHSACMRLLQEAGIYVISDLGEPSLSINRDNPQWDTAIFERYQKVIDELSQYSNVIGYLAGNEVSDQKNNTGASAYVKAAVRDTKNYIKSQKQITRWLGVGYAANDNTDIRDQIAHYFNCDNTNDSIDFWGYNIYSWCGESNAELSGYNAQAAFFANYSVPVFFAEYGCNKDGAVNRKFTETAALYSNNISSVFSGGIVYMYFQEENDFGLVKVEKGAATKLKDFNELKKQVNQATPKAININDYTPAGKMGECPKLTNTWEANKALPPTPDRRLCDCMVKAASCVPKPNLSNQYVRQMFDFTCGSKTGACVGITGHTATGVYGAYSMCDDAAKLTHVLDTYYTSQKRAAGACNFEGNAKLQKSEVDETCKAVLASASIINSQAATATVPVGGKSTGASKEESSAIRIGHSLSLGAGSWGFCVAGFVSLLAGVSMLVL
ncbi:hypothetical protein QQS21_002141 [Conoideocrella luteorostrata]|uniref:1,3-beta-glucanosyltransferase n=1 Tax=Conoideocrella luteorostrata TaxID=1105319 RepID=A0AAJ0CVV0_9HYPO|nr:hypothetical protein QQS21_002141 [Conoideocrella luteorostrata]